MMSISDPKFGAELITDKGRVLKYDATECLAAHLSDGAPAYQALLAVPYDAPGTLVPVNNLYYLISPEYSSPMGANLVSFGNEKSIPEKYQNELLDWAGVIDKLAD
jgi:copper chaperone NosL